MGHVNRYVIVVRVVAHAHSHVLRSPHGPRAGLNAELVCHPRGTAPDPAATKPGVPGPGCRPRKMSHRWGWDMHDHGTQVAPDSDDVRHGANHGQGHHSIRRRDAL
jgi:hypothetical protein